MNIYTEQDHTGLWTAIDENFDGDDHCIVGHGKTFYEAVENYLGEHQARMVAKK